MRTKRVKGEMKTSFLVGFFILCVLGQISTEWATITYTSSLSGDQVVPLPDIYQDSIGNAVCILDRTFVNSTLTCTVQHNIAVLVGATINYGRRGTFGPVLYSFPSTYTYQISATWILSDLEGGNYTVIEQENDFLNGNWYITLTSRYFITGEIRGQIEHSDRAFSILRVENTVPRATSSSASGICLGTYSAFDPPQLLTINVIHTVVDSTYLDVATGIPGAVGPIGYSFIMEESPAYDSMTLSIDEQENFIDDLIYLNLLSRKNPNGEIRGQLISIDYPESVGFTSRLAPLNNVDSDNSGCGIFSYDCDSKLFEFIVMHTIRDSVSVNIGFGAEGENGAILYSVNSRNISAVYGSRYLTYEEVYYLYTYQLFVTVSSTDFEEFEIRGQINTEFDFYAYLSGTFVSSPVTTAAVGCSTFLYTNATRVFDYAIYHSVSSPIEVTLSVGAEGQEGVVDRIFPSVSSPIRGDNFLLDDDEIEALAYENLYVQVVSTSYPYVGEIRGQIKRVKPCKPNDDNQLSLSEPETFNSRLYSSGVTSGQLTSDYFGSSDSSILNANILLIIVIISAYLLVLY